MECIANPILEGNFYASSKKNSFYNVKLNDEYLGLLQTNGTLIKTKIISIRDIIGCRCARRRKTVDEKCECHPKNRNVFSFFEGMPDEDDASSYLHIYAYVLKDFRLAKGQKRERFKITLRFRAYTRYEDNLKEAVKWKNTVKSLVDGKRWLNVSVVNGERCGNNFEKGKRSDFRFPIMRYLRTR